MFLRYCLLAACFLNVSNCFAGDPSRAITEEFIISKLRPRLGVSRSVAIEQALNGTAKDQGGDASLSVDLDVSFAFGSANLTADGEHLLNVLASALNDAQLSAFSFELAGHTDAVGSAAYNQRLSERRAQAVRRFLVQYGKIENSRLIAKGYGKTRLKDPASPESGVNRRVEVSTVNP